MRFTELPFRLRAYILGQVVLLAPLLPFALAHHSLRGPLQDVGLLLLFAVMFSTWKVELTVFQGRMTLAFAVICLAQLHLQLPMAILCAAAGAVAGTLLRPEKQWWRLQVLRPPLYRLVFNAGNCLLACALAGLAYEAVVRHAPDPEMARLAGLAVFTAIYFAINTLGVSLAIAFQQKLSWLTVWQENFLWTAPGYFASASAAAGIHAVQQRFPGWWPVFLPPLYLIYHSYKLYMERLQQDMAHIQELNKLNQAIIASLATAIDAKDSCTSSHINRVRFYATALAQAAGVSEAELQAVATGALVHDIGKLGIPDHILSKPGKLAPEEFRRIQSHVTIGTEILSPIPFPFPVVDVVRTHHERWDGLGYPHGLKGEEIPIGGRIISIVDVFDALTSDRPYRRALSTEAALKVLHEGAGKQFDPRLVGLFEKVLPQARGEIDQMEAQDRLRQEEAEAPQEGASALTQIHQSAAEMAAVCDVAHALAEQETLTQVSQVVVNRALALLPADTAVLYLKEPETGGLVAAAVEGKYQEKLAGMTIQMGEGAAGWVARSGQPRVNVSAALDVARRFTPEETLELSAATVVPLVHGPETLGALAVYTMGYSVLTVHHLNVLNILAEHTAAALQNSRRFERQHELAHTDPLTGLANSRNLVRHLERLTYQDGGRQAVDGSAGDGGRQTVDGSAGDGGGLPSNVPHLSPPELPPTVHRLPSTPCFSVLMMDLDRFKEVNDTLGHLTGDELLRQVAGQLEGAARPEDVVCRYAGDEFVLLLVGADASEALQVGERARAAIDALPKVAGQVKISASVGVATFPEDGADGRTLLHVADQRMYEDKFQRRQSVRLPAGEAVLDLAGEGTVGGRR